MIKFLLAPFDIKKARIKGHFRKLPNGKIIFIQEYHDKRKDAQKNPAAFHGKHVHADEHSTSVVVHEGDTPKVATYKHDPRKELKQDDIHAHLMKPHPVDKVFARKMYEVEKQKEGFKTLDDHKKHLLDEEKKEENPKFKNLEGAHDAQRKEIDTLHKQLVAKYGDSVSPAMAYMKDKAAGGGHYLDYVEHHTDNPESNYHDQAVAKMVSEHTDSALQAREEEKQNIKIAKSRTKADCPKIPHLDSNLKVFGHQAEVLAKLDVLTKAIVDVDMGGGKGLLLPLDAINHMGKGNVKKPLIVCPALTLEQNAKKIHEYTNKGVNVFLISNDTIKKHYGGDVKKMVEDIDNAPPNTIFMATYGVFGYSDANHYKDSDIPEEEQVEYGRAHELSQAGFDYVGLDECLHPHTNVLTQSGEKKIKDVAIGDKVQSALGWKSVVGTRRKHLDRHIELKIEGKTIKCSENHVWFTPGGWVRAKNLKEGDRIVKTSEAMRMVQDGFSRDVGEQSFLQQVLFSEMENESARVQRENKYAGKIEKNKRKVSRKTKGMGSPTHAYEQSNEEQGLFRKNEIHIEEDRAQAEEQDWKRNGTDGGRVYTYARVGKLLGVEFTIVNWQTSSGRSNLLQTGSRAPSIEDCNRMRRLLTPVSLSASPRFEKDRVLESARVDSVTIHESGSDGTNPEGYFYDLEVEGHPSFSVNGLLSHNSHKAKNSSTSTFKSLMHLAGAKYKRVASGTFLANDPFDVMGQTEWLDPSRKMDKKTFAKQYGYTEDKKGRHWDDRGLEKLRQELMDEQGMISLRRSIWMHLLPKRNEQTHKLEGSPKVKLALESSISDSMEMLSALADGDPELANQLENIEDADEGEMKATGVVGQVLEALRGVTDHPHEMAERMKVGMKLRKQFNTEINAAMKKIASENDDAIEAARFEGRKGPRELTEHELLLEAIDDVLIEHRGEVSGEDAAALRWTAYFQPETQKHILNMLNEVSPKALDAYEKMREHLKDPSNGKFMVFMERKPSVQHVFNNMPADLKAQAVWYDGDNKTQLPAFLNEGGPKILIACDASIAEGVNMQVANALYRYDLPFTPGKTEQTYGRIWRFGQKRQADIHVPLVNNSIDVIKYARLQSKLRTNYKVSSGYELSPNVPAFKLNINNIRNNRSYDDVVPDYQDIGKELMQEEFKVNTKVKDQYTGMFDIRGGKEIQGAGETPQHPAYLQHTGELDISDNGKKFDKQDPKLALDYLLKMNAKHKVKKESYRQLIADATELVDHLKERGHKLNHEGYGEVSNPEVTSAFWKKIEKDAGGQAPDAHKKVVNGLASLLMQAEGLKGGQKKEEPKEKPKILVKPKVAVLQDEDEEPQGEKHTHETAMDDALSQHGLNRKKIAGDVEGNLRRDVQELHEHMKGKRSWDKEHEGRYWKAWAHENGMEAPYKHRSVVSHAAKLVHSGARQEAKAKGKSKLKKAIEQIYKDRYVS